MSDHYKICPFYRTPSASIIQKSQCLNHEIYDHRLWFSHDLIADSTHHKSDRHRIRSKAQAATRSNHNLNSSNDLITSSNHYKSRSQVPIVRGSDHRPIVTRSDRSLRSSSDPSQTWPAHLFTLFMECWYGSTEVVAAAAPSFARWRRADSESVTRCRRTTVSSCPFPRWPRSASGVSSCWCVRCTGRGRAVDDPNTPKDIKQIKVWS